MFGKKRKSKEEEERERNERIGATADKLKAQIASIEAQRTTLVSKVVEARRKGLSVQEEQARGLLKRNLAAEKRVSGMLMTLELAVQSRDLAEINRGFLEAIGALSADIRRFATVKGTKQTERQYLGALYASQKQTEALDEMLDVGNYGAAVAENTDEYSEFDDEIDRMVTRAEAAGVRRGQSV